MAPRLSARFEMVISPAERDRLDKWRQQQPDLPSRSEAARRLMRAALDAAGVPMAPDPPDN